MTSAYLASLTVLNSGLPDAETIQILAAIRANTFCTSTQTRWSVLP